MPKRPLAFFTDFFARLAQNLLPILFTVECSVIILKDYSKWSLAAQASWSLSYLLYELFIVWFIPFTILARPLVESTSSGKQFRSGGCTRNMILSMLSRLKCINVHPDDGIERSLQVLFTNLWNKVDPWGRFHQEKTCLGLSCFYVDIGIALLTWVGIEMENGIELHSEDTSRHEGS